MIVSVSIGDVKEVWLLDMHVCMLHKYLWCLYHKEILILNSRIKFSIKGL